MLAPALILLPFPPRRGPQDGMVWGWLGEGADAPQRAAAQPLPLPNARRAAAHACHDGQPPHSTRAPSRPQWFMRDMPYPFEILVRQHNTAEGPAACTAAVLLYCAALHGNALHGGT